MKLLTSFLHSAASKNKLNLGLKILQRNLQTTFPTLSSCHLEHSPNAKLNKSILDRYLSLPIPECKCQVVYVWIDGTGENVRSKCRTFDFLPTSYQELPIWSFDGSSTGQSVGNISDNYLCPCALYNDPITRGNNKIVLCETYDPEHKPCATNKRASCVEALNEVCDCEPWFGFEQEYQFLDVDQRLYGWPIMMGEPPPAAAYYCGVGGDKVYCREIVEAHYRACLYSGVMLYGTNSEVTLSQWEFQVGTGEGVKMADDLWMARYLLWRIAEEYGICVSFHPKMIPHWNGSGCHTNFSTKAMREEGGIKEINAAIEKLSKKHSEHIKKYDPHDGKDNVLRLSGKYETSAIDKFTHGVGLRGSSVRIPTQVAEQGKGFLEDRRPASNCDPYSVIDIIIRTCLINSAK